MYFSINFKNEERTPKAKTPMVKSPSLGRKQFEESTFTEKSGAWDTDFMDSFLGDQG